MNLPDLVHEPPRELILRLQHAPETRGGIVPFPDRNLQIAAVREGLCKAVFAQADPTPRRLEFGAARPVQRRAELLSRTRP